MPDDPLESVLRLVEEGRLTAEEAGPILDAMAARQDRQDRPGPRSGPGHAAIPAPESLGTGTPGGPAPGPGRAIRLEVREGGRPVVNLRVPLSLGKAVLGKVPGLSEATAQQIRDALDAGVTGSILDVAESSGDTVRVVIE